MNVVKSVFNNQSQLVKWLENQKPLDGRTNPITQHYSKSFTTVSSWDETLEYMRKGYMDGYEKIKRSYTTAVKQYDMSVSQDYKLNKCGFMPSIPHYLSGNPLNMLDFTDAEQIDRKVYAVNIDTSVPARVEASDIVTAGAKLLTAINAIEKGGNRVSLNATMLTVDDFNSPSAVVGFSVTVKESDSAIDLKRLSYALTCPAFQRVTKFAYYDFCCPSSVYDRSCKGYSVSVCDKPTQQRVLKEYGAKGTYIGYLDIIDHNLSIDDIIKIITA